MRNRQATKLLCEQSKPGCRAVWLPECDVPQEPLPILADGGGEPPAKSGPDRQLTHREAGEQLKVVNLIVARVNDEIITREDIYRGYLKQIDEEAGPDAG